jgi:putative membrane fusion protein
MLKDTKLNMPSEEIVEGAPVIRIIESYKWSIIVELNTKQAEGIEKGKILRIRPIGEKKELKSIVRNVIEEEDKTIVIFDLDEFIDNIYNIRTLTVDIVQSQYEGAMVANSSIVEKDGIKGVYTVDVNGIAKFKPIKVKISNSEYSIVYDGSFVNKSKEDPEKTENVKTINLYDEVVMKGSKVKEGQRVR